MTRAPDNSLTQRLIALVKELPEERVMAGILCR